MNEVTSEVLAKKNYLLYIETPFCGTCHVAKAMLEQIEAAHKQAIFYEMNASFYPEFMQEKQIESVPCLLIMEDGRIKEKIYAFQSIPNIYQYLIKYQPDLFTE